MNVNEVATIIMAAGRGSRMQGYDGNKTLLPLVPEKGIYHGSQPILKYILTKLPAGPKAIVVHHRKSDIIQQTAGMGITYCYQPRLNGTGGAILAAEDFLVNQRSDGVIITMGDVPFVKEDTYLAMVTLLERYPMVVLGFCPQDKKQYGVLETEADLVVKITEWKDWKNYGMDRQAKLTICNSGIYSVKRDLLLRYMPVMAARPQLVRKQVGDRFQEIEEYFLTDLVEYLAADGEQIGFMVAENENETMGVDDRHALQLAQDIYGKMVLAQQISDG